MEASKKTLKELGDISGNIVSFMIINLRYDLLLEGFIKQAHSKTPECQKYVDLLKLAQGLRIGCSFSLADTGALLSSEFKASTPIEKRFILKNMYASITEGYKLIYSFGKSRAHTYISKLKKISPDEFKRKITKLEEKLISFGNNQLKDRDLRNIAYHYDDDMLIVYDKTIEISDEESILQTVKGYVDIIQTIYLLLDEIIYKYISNDYLIIPECNIDFKMGDSGIHRVLIAEIKKQQIPMIIQDNLMSSAKTIDNISKTMKTSRGIKKIMAKEGIADNLIIKVIDNVYEIQNAFLVLYFYYADLASIIMAYINSSSIVESVLLFRRIHILYVSTLEHLYGYNRDQKMKSFWAKVKDIIPLDNINLQKEAEDIEQELSGLIENKDYESRHLYAHYANNFGGYFNTVGNMLNSLDNLNPNEVIKKSERLLRVTTRIQSCLNNLQDTLAKAAEKSRKKSEQELNIEFDKRYKAINGLSIPEEEKEKLLKIMKGIQSNIKEIP